MAIKIIVMMVILIIGFTSCDHDSKVFEYEGDYQYFDFGSEIPSDFVISSKGDTLLLNFYPAVEAILDCGPNTLVFDQSLNQYPCNANFFKGSLGFRNDTLFVSTHYHSCGFGEGPSTDSYRSGYCLKK